MQSIRFIGVCVMGRSMVKNLLTAGYPKAVGQMYFGCAHSRYDRGNKE